MKGTNDILCHWWASNVLGTSLSPDSLAPQHAFFCEKCPDISMPREIEALPRKKCQSKALARGFSDEMAMEELSPQDIHGQLTAQF